MSARTVSPATTSARGGCGRASLTRRRNTRRPWRRSGLAGLLGAVLALAPAGIIAADEAGPTDYETVVIGVEPATPSIEVSVVGGDSFVQLDVEQGTEVMVLGYDDEPYLRFSADGTVHENRQSPTRALNEDRYASGAPDGDPDAPPEWSVVARDGRYAWHDHRAHWMSTDSPPGSQRGERIQDGVIPIEVDGTATTVSVTVHWMPAPSVVPLAAGTILAGFAATIVLLMRRRLAWVLGVAGVAAVVIGWWQVRSVPPETGPSPMSWVLPALALGSALLALAVGRSLVSHALVLLGALELAVWAYLRRAGLSRAILPTDAPYWLDRGITSAAGMVAVISLAAAVLAMFRTEIAGDPGADRRESMPW